MIQMANENLKAQKIYGKYIKELPQVTEVNDTDDIIIEDSTPITSRAKLGVLFDSIKKRIASNWRFAELNNKTIVEYASELNKNIPRFYSKTTALTYSNAKCMKGKAYVGEQFSGCFPQLTLLAKTQQPYTQTNAVISDQVDSQGNVNILAYGSGYVSGHVLTVAVFVYK
jgi:hypothetical protein